MYYDYHMHCSFSEDSKTPMEDMINKSIDLGIKEICFTDHVDYSVIINDKETDIDVDFKDYFKTIHSFQEKYKDRIIIKKGIEMGLQNHILDKCREDVVNHDFDFVIASVHTIDKIELIQKDFYKDKTQLEAYRQYYEILYNMISKYKDYSVLGHLDIVKRYGDLNNIIDDKVFSDEIDEILKMAIYEGKGIEINTSSFRYRLPDLTPSSYILKRYRELGGEILTTGSDSHNTAQVAHEFKYIYEKLQDIGYRYVCTFDKMKPNFIKL
ncbi:MAG: histidinol-phosphatase HisJ family protein [Terrisporobacter sp.]|uniref:histidinol-phosphatase HisJ family protein n=1 Tax=Terrisporobacter sp. TaxID=1965305 RepID=UPI002FCBB481